MLAWKRGRSLTSFPPYVLRPRVQVGNAPLNAVVFGAYGHMQRVLNRYIGPETQTMASHMGHVTACAMWAGLLQTAVATPVELVKCKLQMDGVTSSGTPQYKGPIDCLRKVWGDLNSVNCHHPRHASPIFPLRVAIVGQMIKANGFLKGAYRGFAVTAWRDVPGFVSRTLSPSCCLPNTLINPVPPALQAFYFLGYEWTKRVLNPSPSDVSPMWTLLVAGAVAGVLGVRGCALPNPPSLITFSLFHTASHVLADCVLCTSVSLVVRVDGGAVTPWDPCLPLLCSGA